MTPKINNIPIYEYTKNYTIITYSSGNKFWFKKHTSIRHREDGPAVEFFDGSKEWWYNGVLHREDGPAIDYLYGNKEWYQNGILHREDGPAIDYVNGAKLWYYKGKKINCSSQEEFEKILKLKVFW